MLHPCTRATRVTNSLRKLAAGLTPHGESVWPGVQNDLFVAHLSVYYFFERFVANRRVLDAGCGTGYGAYHLATNGASSIVGIDLDPRSIRYARRHFSAPNLSFQVADCDALDLPPASFDVVVASNVLEHLREPARFIDSARILLADSGPLVLVLPPIWSEADLRAHSHVPYHRSNLSIEQWLELFTRGGWRIDLYRHLVPPGRQVDFASPFRSVLRPSDFPFGATDKMTLYSEPVVSVAYVLTRGA